ncbi:MAG: alpha-D-QuiNAc alpha-1 3-galactosyltransferase [Rhodospirillaceae bacterium]|nr:MAG: alpha-D-QuiNAc alpha-1 3-galactosyltransferase [Rhodospirillaceae bacterium]
MTAEKTQTARPRLLFLIAEDWFFCSHYIERAAAARTAGYDVVVMTHVTSHADAIRARGLRVRPWRLHRGSINPVREAWALAEVWRAYRAERPDIVHHVALKPVLYGSLAARLAGIGTIVNAPVGMGYIFSSADRRARILREPLRVALLWLLSTRQGKVIFQNRDDRQEMLTCGFVHPGNVVLIRGSGVDVTRFQPTPEPEGTPVVLLAARMLWDKGVGEFVAAARALKREGVAARFCLAGDPDPLNHGSVPEATLRAWQAEGIIEWLGFRADMAELLRMSHLACLPSYREGLPKSLLEAAAAGRAIVTTDVPGCREAVTHGRNGLLVPVRDPVALAEALKHLLLHPSLRVALGREGRKRAIDEFSQEIIVRETLQLYHSLLLP